MAQFNTASFVFSLPDVVRQQRCACFRSHRRRRPGHAGKLVTWYLNFHSNFFKYLKKHASCHLFTSRTGTDRVSVLFRQNDYYILCVIIKKNPDNREIAAISNTVFSLDRCHFICPIKSVKNRIEYVNSCAQCTQVKQRR